jgi:hypothetical protein
VELQSQNWRFLLRTQVVVLIVAMAVATYLQMHDKLSGGMGTLIGTLVGFGLGRSTKN